MYIKEAILVCYMLCLLLSVSGLTISLLAHNKSGSGRSRTLAFFLVGILIMCCYDMALYYCDYVMGMFDNMKLLRIGNCIIAANLYLWIDLQDQIIKRDALKSLDKVAQRYLLIYIALWSVMTFTLDVENFYTIKWLLLASDIILIILSLTAAVGHIIYASTSDRKIHMYYMIIGTSMIIWNYISYFWGETSVYWGNSEFIREPLDLTVVFWLMISASTLVYEYREDFVPAFGKTGDDENKGQKDLSERISDVALRFRLTPREKELIELIYSGKSNKEIAEILFLSESTVKTHIYNIFRKMDVKNRMGVIYIVNENNEDDKPQL